MKTHVLTLQEDPCNTSKLHSVVPMFSHLSWIVSTVEESVLVLGNSLKYLRSKVAEVHSGLSILWYMLIIKCASRYKERGFKFQCQMSTVGCRLDVLTMALALSEICVER